MAMDKHRQTIADAVSEAVALRTAFTKERENWLLSVSEGIVSSLRAGGNILIAGNGGSAADSQHFAAEMVVRLTAENTRAALPAIALTTDTSILTAGANDLGFEHVFSRQIEALGKAGDVFIGLSTSGSSPNILAAFQIAKERELRTVGLFGKNGCAQPDLCDLPLNVPSLSTMRIQEEHTFALHLLALLIERMLAELV